MKNLFFIFISILFISSSLMANNPLEGNPLINSEESGISVISELGSTLFESATYNFEEESLDFETTQTISFIQIYNESGKLEFQLPVGSKDVSIGKSLFGTGTYKLGFIIDGKGVTEFTEVVMN